MSHRAEVYQAVVQSFWRLRQAGGNPNVIKVHPLDWPGLSPDQERVLREAGLRVALDPEAPRGTAYLLQEDKP